MKASCAWIGSGPLSHSLDAEKRKLDRTLSRPLSAYELLNYLEPDLCSRQLAYGLIVLRTSVADLTEERHPVSLRQRLGDEFLRDLPQTLGIFLQTGQEA